MGIQSGIRKTPYIGASDLPVPRNVPDRLKSKDKLSRAQMGREWPKQSKEKAPTQGRRFSISR